LFKINTILTIKPSAIPIKRAVK